MLLAVWKVTVSAGSRKTTAVGTPLSVWTQFPASTERVTVSWAAWPFIFPTPSPPSLRQAGRNRQEQTANATANCMWREVMASSFLLCVQHYHAVSCCQVKLLQVFCRRRRRHFRDGKPPHLDASGMVFFMRARLYSIRAISRVAVARVVQAFRPAVKAPAQLLASAAEVVDLSG